MGKQFNCPLGSIYSSHEGFPYFSLSSWYSFKKDATSFLSFLMLMFFSPFNLKMFIVHIKIKDPVVLF